MIKRFDKKGAINWDQFLALIIGVVAVGIVIFYFMGGFDNFFDVAKQGDLVISAMQTKCESLDDTGYCTDRLELAKDSYVNCGYAVKNLGVKIDNSPATCVDADAIAMCNRIKWEEGDDFVATKVKVNDKACSEWNPVADGNNPANK